jgi:hypothetical protein
MYVRGHVGMGQIESINTAVTDALPDAYSDTATLTGLPVVWEIGLAILGGVLLMPLFRRGKSAASSGVKRARRRVAKAIQG